MKKGLIVIALLTLCFRSDAQFIHGSVKQGSNSNKVDILFKPTFNSNANEYVNYVQFSLTIPISAYTAGLTASLVGVGNFATLSFAQAAQYTQASTSERVFTWICLNPAVTAMSWTANTEFVGATVTFTGGVNSSQVKMADYSNAGGGSNNNTFFIITCTQHGPAGDVTDYSNFFYATPLLSTLGTYANSDQWVQTVALIALPANILSFSGYGSGSSNILNWKTSSEQNSRGFEVQRSLDGVNYVAIGFVNSQAVGGNSTSQLDYGFTDYNIAGEKHYYRLRLISMDNKSWFSNIVIIRDYRPSTLKIEGLYPNPATNMVNVLIGSPGHDKVTLVLTDMMGKMVTQKITEVQTGSNTIPIDISVLSNGTYIVKMVSSHDFYRDENVVGKFVKQ
jgi:hypothetical protein